MYEWPVGTVRDVAAAQGLVGGPFGSLLGAKDYVAAGVPVIRGVNLAGDGFFDASEFVHVSPAKATGELARNLARPGDVVFTQRGTLGQVGVVPAGPHDTSTTSSGRRGCARRSVPVPSPPASRTSTSASSAACRS
jgi:type I restriction enzyme, S subunit